MGRQYDQLPTRAVQSGPVLHGIHRTRIRLLSHYKLTHFG